MRMRCRLRRAEQLMLSFETKLGAEDVCKLRAYGIQGCTVDRVSNGGNRAIGLNDDEAATNVN